MSAGILRCDKERPLGPPGIPLPDSPGLTCLWLVFIVPQVPQAELAPVLPILGLVWHTLEPCECPLGHPCV